MEYNEDDNEVGSSSLLGSGTLINNFLQTQLNLISTSLIPLTTPLLSLRHPRHPKSPSSVAAATHQMVRRVGYGLLGTLYTGVVLTLVMVVAVVIGVVVVNHWVEESVVVRERLFFDYSEANPDVVALVVVPGGHRVHVALVLLLPYSDYNRHLGVFQLMAEVVSGNGRIIARTSQPTMLQYLNDPIRLTRTFLMSLPLVFGFTRETQKITVQMLSYKEDSMLRTEAIKITQRPRAGASFLPQLYEAELLLHSKLPRVKELVHNWKWTFYVWVSLYMYIVLLLLLGCFLKPLLDFPALRASVVSGGLVTEREEKPETRRAEEREFSETLKKWQQYRRKRKAELLSRSFVEDIGATSASSYTITKEDTGSCIEEDVVDSESVCLGG